MDEAKDLFDKMVKILEKYPGRVIVSSEGTEVDGKRMMEISMLAATEGQTVDVMLERVKGIETGPFYTQLESVFEHDPS